MFYTSSEFSFSINFNIKTYFSILHYHFTKTPTSDCLLFNIFSFLNSNFLFYYISYPNQNIFSIFSIKNLLLLALCLSLILYRFFFFSYPHQNSLFLLKVSPLSSLSLSVSSLGCLLSFSSSFLLLIGFDFVFGLMGLSYCWV